MARVASVSVDEFVAAAVGLSQGDFETEPMTRLLTQARLRDEDVARFLRFDPDRYTRCLIHRTDDVEILALAWPAASVTPIHDHAGQRCWMVAQSGVFVVDDYRQIAGVRAPGYAVVEHLGTTPHVTIGMPDYRGERGGDIHRVRVAPECDRAVSIHVYAKPYTSCLMFDEIANEAREISMDVDLAPL
ncbi:MAG TPA: cysteine dioxygenase family protein [Candidatus Tyrphobacter sp.]